jgi:peptidyl-prolyl cis-trans isomerase D
MLQKLNERIQGMIAWIVIVLVAITFLLFGLDYYVQSRQKNSTQVSVNGYPITKQTVDINYQRLRQSRQPSQITHINERRLKEQLLHEMVVNEVSVQGAQSSGFVVSDAQANAAILSIPQFQDKGHFSNDRYVHVLTSALFTPRSFQTEVRQGMLLNQQRFALIGTALMLPDDLKHFVKLFLQKRDYQYMQISADNFLKLVSVSEDNIVKYYQLHRKQFVAPEQISIDYIQLSLKNIKKNIHIAEDDIKHYYSDNQSTMHQGYEEVKETIRAQLMAEAAQTVYAKQLEQLSDASYQSPDSLKAAADLLKLPIQHSVLFSADGGDGRDDSLLKNKQVVGAAFSNDVLNLGNNSDPIQIDNDSVVVLRVNRHIPAAEKTLDSVRSTIQKKLIQQKAAEAAKILGQQILALNQQPSDYAQLVSQHHLSWHTVLGISREGDNATTSLNEWVFGLPRAGAYAGHQLMNGDYVIIKLQAIHDGELSQLDKEQVNSIAQQIETNYGLMDYEFYMNGLMKKAQIVKH